ncbi:MAG: hypothetical protein IKY80_05270 [Alistipes sp.]|nr:hypothetical protein [Alistipes sp.]
MSIIYRVRIKVADPHRKVKYLDGVYVSNGIVSDATNVKEDIASRVKRQLGSSATLAVVEVVLFRRSDIGFILSENSEDLENSK